MASVTIEDRGEITEINGTNIGHSQTNSAVKPRWMTIDLYRLDSGGLLLHRASYSRVYHDNTGRCRTSYGRVPSGKPATVDDLPDDAEPCPKCKPADPEYLGDTETIRFEFARHTFDRCESAEDVLEKMRRRDGSGTYSEPSQSVIDQAREKDPEFTALPKIRVSY